LGLELAGERYGLQAVAKVKQLVLSLNGAPQASLRTAAIRFYSAIKEIKPGPPAERSAFSFISEEAAPADDDDGGFTFGQPEAKGEQSKDPPAEEEGEMGKVEGDAQEPEPDPDPGGDVEPAVTEPDAAQAQTADEEHQNE
jgi:hypothetical protein